MDISTASRLLVRSGQAKAKPNRTEVDPLLVISRSRWCFVVGRSARSAQPHPAIVHGVARRALCFERNALPRPRPTSGVLPITTRAGFQTDRVKDFGLRPLAIAEVIARGGWGPLIAVVSRSREAPRATSVSAVGAAAPVSTLARLVSSPYRAGARRRGAPCTGPTPRHASPRPATPRLAPSALAAAAGRHAHSTQNPLAERPPAPPWPRRDAGSENNCLTTAQWTAWGRR